MFIIIILIFVYSIDFCHKSKEQRQKSQFTNNFCCAAVITFAGVATCGEGGEGWKFI
jgi:hypothetical protein